MRSRFLRSPASACALVIVLVTAALLVDAPAAAEDRAAPPPITTPWLWPVDGERSITRGYEAPANPWGPGHRGIDIAVHADQEVRSPAPGTVFFVGMVVNRPVITVAHKGDVLSSYEAVAPAVELGDVVDGGDLLGTVTTGPHCGTSCLHVGVRVHGEYVNPLLFFGGIERAVLLPLASAPSAEGRPHGSHPRGPHDDANRSGKPDALEFA